MTQWDILLFPAKGLLDRADFRLADVEDVLLRFDFYSVDDTPEVRE